MAGVHIRTLAAIALAAAMLRPGPALAQSLQPPVDSNTLSKPVVYAVPASVMADIVRTMHRQLQPCADRQLIPAPEAMGIFLVVQLDLNRDGSLANFRIVGRQGINDANRAYLPDVERAVETIFTECTPFQGLPAEYYDGPRGWRTIKIRYQMKA